MQRIIPSSLYNASDLALNPNGEGIILAEQYPSYSAAVTDLAVAAAPTCVVTVTPSGKNIYIKHVRVTGSATTAVKIDCQLLKRSYPNSGGTFSLLTPVSYDGNDSPSSTIVRAYTVNPTTSGPLIGMFASEHIVLPAETAPNNTIYPFIYIPDEMGMKPITLHGNETFCIDLNGNAITGGLIHVTVAWIER